jgi:hypothetical protein
VWESCIYNLNLLRARIEGTWKAIKKFFSVRNGKSSESQDLETREDLSLGMKKYNNMTDNGFTYV